MFGPPGHGLRRVDTAALGVGPRSVTELVAAAERVGSGAYVAATFLEVYNERVLDLLASRGSGSDGSRPPSPGIGSGGGSSVRVREHPKAGVYVDGITTVPIASQHELLRVIDRASDIHRRATAMNDNSSRSHTILTLSILQPVASGTHD